MKYFNLIFLVSMSLIISGCASSAKIIRGEEPIGIYEEVYLVKPEKDPRNLVDRVVLEFENIGLKVNLIERDEPLKGSQGTGFFINESGYILTCAHVLGNEKEATIWANDKRYEADLISKDDENDLAILKIRNEDNNIYPLFFREKEKISLGESVYAMGYPLSSVLGDNIRLSNGLISSTKGIKDDPNQIQISAAIQPGNSGGPVLGSSGEIIGVVQQTINPLAVFQQTKGALPQNINFAVKSEVVKNFMAENNIKYKEISNKKKIDDFEKIEKSVVKIISGIVPEGDENKAKLVAVFDYLSMWDIWYRFKYFVFSFYDLDKKTKLFQAGQGHDNMVSNENVVIRDTFKKIGDILSEGE